MAFGFLFLEPPSDFLTVREVRVGLEGYGYRTRRKRTRFDRTNINIYKGDTEILVFQAYKGQKVADLSGYTIRAQARITPQSIDPLFDIEIIDGVDGSDFVNGRFGLNLPSSLTTTLPSMFRYDIQGIYADIVSTLVVGQMKVQNDVVKP